MSIYVRAILLILLLSTFTALGQDDSQQFVFDETGVTFTVPAGAAVDDSGTIPSLAVSDMLIEMVEPAIIGAKPDSTAGASLTEILDFLLGFVGYTETRSEADTFAITLADGREAVVFDFVNSSGDSQSVFVLRMSNTHVAFINIRAGAALNSEQRDIVLALAASFDSPAAADEAELAVDPVAELTAGLTESHTFASGVSFSYPPEYAIAVSDGAPVQIGIRNVLEITVIDPSILGMPSGEPMANVAEFAAAEASFSAEDFEPLDIGGREAMIASGESEQLIQTMVLVRFDDGTVGILDMFSIDTLKDDQMAEVRGIAASFNSASDTAAAPTREDIEQAEALFEEAMDVRDAGDLEAALPLFDESIQLNDTSPLVWYWRALTHKDIGSIDASLADLQRAKAIDPTVVPILLALTEVYVLADDIEAALAELEGVAEIQGSEASQGMLSEIEMYREILAGELVVGFYVNRANRYTSLGLYEQAVEDMDLLIAAQPDNWEWHARLGNIYAAADDYRESIQTYTDALEIESRAIIYYNRAVTYQDSFASEIGSIPDALLQTDYNYRCSILLADDSITEDLLAAAERALVTILISDDDYEPPGDPADCVP